MSLFKFVIWFVLGLVGTAFLVSIVKNAFIVGFIVGLIIGILGAKDS